jgi:hypothetical protein
MGSLPGDVQVRDSPTRRRTASHCPATFGYNAMETEKEEINLFLANIP